MMVKPIARLALILGLAAPAAPAFADPALGIGVSFVFGGDTAIGLRIFSDDEPEELVASIGVDYVIGAQRVRPTVGAAYLDENIYFGLDMGYDFSRGMVDFSVGIGAVNTDEPASAPAPAPEPVIELPPLEQG
jgi:hypothetical protein